LGTLDTKHPTSLGTGELHPHGRLVADERKKQTIAAKPTSRLRSQKEKGGEGASGRREWGEDRSFGGMGWDIASQGRAGRLKGEKSGTLARQGQYEEAFRPNRGKAKSSTNDSPSTIELKEEVKKLLCRERRLIQKKRKEQSAKREMNAACGPTQGRRTEKERVRGKS